MNQKNHSPAARARVPRITLRAAGCGHPSYREMQAAMKEDDVSEQTTCERCGKPEATEADAAEAGRLDDPAFDARFCWAQWNEEECEDTRLERMQAKLTRLRDAAKKLCGSRWWHLCSDGVGGCIAVSETNLDALAAAIAESEQP